MTEHADNCGDDPLLKRDPQGGRCRWPLTRRACLSASTVPRC
jgi:hypothetical protein